MKKILIADDNEFIRNLCIDTISYDFPGYEIEDFEDGTSLAERLEKDVSCVNLVLTDNSMPGINGSEIIRRYAKDSRFIGKIPFILAYGDDESIGKKAIEDGAFDYILKPFGVPKLTSLLQRAFSQYKS